MNISVESIDLGEIEGGVGVSVEEMQSRISARLAEIVPDPEAYEIDAQIEFEEENGIYIATGKARHIEMDRTVLSLSRVTGDTPGEIAANALYKGGEFFGTDELIVDIGSFIFENSPRIYEDEGNFVASRVRVYLKEVF